jgi:aryl-alcohol dehydrogenase-like predicted oxidoreductase
VAWSPLARGVLSGKFHKNPELIEQAPLGRRMMLRRGIEHSRPLVEALENVAANYSATPAQVALNWLINSQGETVVAIPGASKERQAEDSAGAMQFKLSEEDMARLDELSREYR